MTPKLKKSWAKPDCGPLFEYPKNVRIDAVNGLLRFKKDAQGVGVFLCLGGGAKKKKTPLIIRGVSARAKKIGYSEFLGAEAAPVFF